MVLSYPSGAVTNRFGWLNAVWECVGEGIDASSVAIGGMKCYKFDSN